MDGQIFEKTVRQTYANSAHSGFSAPIQWGDQDGSWGSMWRFVKSVFPAALPNLSSGS
jgi:hypothetical protein